MQRKWTLTLVLASRWSWTGQREISRTRALKFGALTRNKEPGLLPPSRSSRWHGACLCSGSLGTCCRPPGPALEGGSWPGRWGRCLWSGTRVRVEASVGEQRFHRFSPPAPSRRLGRSGGRTSHHSPHSAVTEASPPKTNGFQLTLDMFHPPTALFSERRRNERVRKASVCELPLSLGRTSSSGCLLSLQKAAAEPRPRHARLATYVSSPRPLYLRSV